MALTGLPRMMCIHMMVDDVSYIGLGLPSARLSRRRLSR